jgi:uncharacterized membrane protein YuzA (DUF378 family)
MVLFFYYYSPKKGEGIMMKSPMSVVCMLAKLIVALAAINVGLSPFGFNFFATPLMMTTMAPLVTPLHYVILAAGLLMLWHAISHCMGKCCAYCSKKGM